MKLAEANKFGLFFGENVAKSQWKEKKRFLGDT